MIRYILDACALIALLQDENGAEKVSTAINAAFNGEATVTMNRLNLLEVYYDVFRSRGKEQADLMLLELTKCPITISSEINDKVFFEAGRLKASYKISLADSIALAETIVSDGALLTADHHEFDVIEQSERIEFCWIR